MKISKRPSVIVGIVVFAIASGFVARFVYIWWHIPEAYAAWDAGDMLLWYMRTHDDDWPDNWDEFQAAVENEPALFLRGRYPDEPDYMGRMRRTIKIDWSFDPTNPQNPRPVTRPDGAPLHTYWSDPNGMIFQYLDRQEADEP
ncbi:hypothetical protein [Roseiconus lacunae]|nr:hypothetical protein [Roseiconus lacunae]MCD0457923.1 hypothetical protein [Roseiconus lacunae]